ncbi:MAG TPA: hypothetical protein VGF28_05115 [Thermoanaerobaculia bacterium]|jgi:hypothetical protein
MSIVYSTPEMESVEVRPDVPFADGLVMDVYTPPGVPEPERAVVIVAGYPDPGFQRKLGFRFKDMPSNVAWARLIAAAGLTAITYTNVEPVSGLSLLLDTLGERPVSLLASSGNVPLALSALHRARCAALLYGFMLEVEGAIAETAKTFGFANPGFTFPGEKPLFVARAGQDQFPRLNETLDAFVVEALRRNAPLTFANHPEGPHAFDLSHDSGRSREIIRQAVAFLQTNA